MNNNLVVNPGKQEFVESGGKRFSCRAVRTKVVTEQDRLEDIVKQFIVPAAKPGDIVFISEKMVACTQGRALPVQQIHAGTAARILSHFVTRTPYGIGLAMPETMQCAINEVGLPRILKAAAIGAVGKLFQRKGWFYKIAGDCVAAIDGPCSYTLPPYNQYVVLSPLNPDWTAERISQMLGGNLTLVVDLNDLGGKILGSSDKQADLEALLELLKQNPLGQSDQRTPIGILRPLG